MNYLFAIELLDPSERLITSLPDTLDATPQDTKLSAA